MKFISKLKNYKLKVKEKFSNAWHYQLLRLIKMFCMSPLKSIKGGVLKAMINLTYRCDCDCDYCWCGNYAKYPDRELSNFEIKKILNEIAKYSSIFTLVSFIGGEPFLREDIYELIDYASKKGLFTEMETNGIKLSKSEILKLKNSGLSHIFVKIEGSDANKHNKLAKTDGCFEKAIDGIKMCVKEGLSCSIFMNVSKKKIKENEVSKIIDLGRSLRVNSVRMIYPMLSGRWVTREDQRLTDEEKKRVEKLLDPGFVYLESSDAVYRGKERMCAALGRKFFHISCYGEVQPCPFVPMSFGNLRSKALVEILNSMWSHPIFNAGYEGCLMNNPDFRARYILPARLDISYKNISL